MISIFIDFDQHCDENNRVLLNSSKTGGGIWPLVVNKCLIVVLHFWTSMVWMCSNELLLFSKYWLKLGNENSSMDRY